MNPEILLAKVEEALRQISPMAAAGWAQALSIERQLVWCRNHLSGQPNEPKPGPFSMGLNAVREFDMYGQDPELAALINEIERAMS